MPVRFRGRLWSLCIGNGLAISKNAYSNALARAKKGLEEGREGISKFREEAEEEMERVLPTLKLFQKKGGVMHEDLLDLLLAWSVHDQPMPRYVSLLSLPVSKVSQKLTRNSDFPFFFPISQKESPIPRLSYSSTCPLPKPSFPSSTSSLNRSSNPSTLKTLLPSNPTKESSILS